MHFAPRKAEPSPQSHQCYAPTRCSSAALALQRLDEFLSHPCLYQLIQISAFHTLWPQAASTRQRVLDMQQLIWGASAHGHVVTFRQVVFKLTPSSSDFCCHQHHVTPFPTLRHPCLATKDPLLKAWWLFLSFQGTHLLWQRKKHHA